QYPGSRRIDSPAIPCATHVSCWPKQPPTGGLLPAKHTVSMRAISGRHRSCRMLTRQQKEQYYRDGYLLVPDILTADQVAWLRAFFRPKFDCPKFLADTHHVLVDIFGRYPEVRWLCFHEPTLAVVRALFGEDIVLLPE